MKATICHNWNRDDVRTYGLLRDDLADFVAIIGWTAVNHIEGMTDADRAELDRLGELDSLPIREDAVDWLRSRRIA